MALHGSPRSSKGVSVDDALGVAAKFSVDDVLIHGNIKTKDSVIEAQIGALRDATSLQELVQAARLTECRLYSLGVFSSVNITIHACPSDSEIPCTANVVIEVTELKNPWGFAIAVCHKQPERSSSLEGSGNLKNVFGYGDLWDGSFTCGWDQSEMSFGVMLPRLRWMITPMAARFYLLSQDWLQLSSYKERSLGAAIWLLATRNHDLVYNVAWRTLIDPSGIASNSIRRQLGKNLLSSLKYTMKLDTRDSSLRPTSGYCIASTTQVSGLTPNSRALRFLRQDFDLRYALPLGLGVSRGALNLGLSGGLIFPWGSGFLDKPSSLPDRYFLGGNSSPVISLGGPSSLLGFKCRGLGPTDLRGQTKFRDALGGDLAITAFADLSFDLPLKLLRQAGIYAHVFACAGSLTELAQNKFRNLSLRNFFHSFRSSVGFGVIIPTKLFTMEVNYCYILRQNEHDNGKTGLQFSFSSPS